MLELRNLIYETSIEIGSSEPLTESLKWGQPTYSTLASKSGTPIRIDRFEDDQVAIFVHCQTSLIEDYREILGDTLTFSKNRAVVLNPAQPLPKKELKLFIGDALTYHQK
ncbi:hypothetical protein MFLO_13343 [Listeria floridensis FSL S10-1187]|uniref:YdhG-like domain-containing protein n=1 Tax=Listeria floridensis FSL S10-1187 TaxID=1265817 RepID=A0ABP3AWQ0_9LIST|nr:DUF1801 domain-containing protein [Listeria floridensis]EUJ27446.1 hypothetical protein MFLO_13343 [Listeria floridensis FSL S10-1187]